MLLANGSITSTPSKRQIREERREDEKKKRTEVERRERREVERREVVRRKRRAEQRREEKSRRRLSLTFTFLSLAPRSIALWWSYKWQWDTVTRVDVFVTSISPSPPL
jgi:hypothetical protein